MKSAAFVFVVALLGFAAGACAPAMAATGTIFAQPGTAAVGQPVTFSVNATPTIGLPTTFALNFGDGTSTAVTPPATTLIHQYGTPGTKLVTLMATSPSVRTVVARTIVTVLPTVVPNIARVPLGEILDTVTVGSPVLAGTQLGIILHYRIASPFASLDNGLTDLQAVVDLHDARGKLVRRSDPVPLSILPLAPSAIQTAVIPYFVPVDAGGNYEIVVYIRASQGGTIASSRALRIHVLGGPDPAPILHNVIHLNGALVAGPPVPGSSGSLNFGMTTALQWPTYGLTITGLYDPISRKSDPLFDLASATPGPVAAPDAQSSAAPPASAQAKSSFLKYNDLFGRTQTALPQFLGGGETLRGVDATYDYTSSILHAAFGYTQLPTASTGGRRAALFDYTRAWSPDYTLHFTVTNNRDDVGSFISIGNTHPLDGTTGMLEYNRAFNGRLTGDFAVGESSSHDLFTNESTPGASERADLKYSPGKDTYELEYHNAGEAFATGTGLGAQADRIGGSFNANLALSPISQVALTFSRDDLHSIFSRDAVQTATFTLAPPAGAALTLNVQRAHQLSLSSDAFTSGVTFSLTRAVGNGTWDASGSVSALHDTLQPNSDGTSRTLKLDYQFRAGASALGFGVAGSNVSGATANTIIGETIDYGTSFGALAPALGGQAAAGGSPQGTLATRRFELHASFSNTNTRQLPAGGRDTAWNALLSYHLTPQAALGVTWASQQHSDLNSLLNRQVSGLNFRLDLNI